MKKAFLLLMSVFAITATVHATEPEAPVQPEAVRCGISPLPPCQPPRCNPHVHPCFM